MNKKTWKNIGYHVFADGIDDWANTLKVANAIFNDLKKAGYKNIRIYKNRLDVDMAEEVYVRGIGNFPY